ncbi:MAG TPA: hypothetical protein VK686_26070 [Bryobacteraceae bacterium]|nr:hypothetical protein [Bryobacteraceae bacterium]
MDGRPLFQSVLNPREKLLWTGAPPFASGRRLGAIAIGLLFLVTVALFFAAAPIPPHLGFRRTAGVFFGVALFCTVPFSLIRFGLRGDGTKAYALTNQRLLMTVGPRREDVRMVALTALAPVEVMRQLKHDKMVQFSLPGGGLLRYARPIWRCLDSGRLDTWGDLSWYVDDPDRVRKLIEDARIAATVKT